MRLINRQGWGILWTNTQCGGEADENRDCICSAERKTTGTDVEFYAEKTGTVRVTCTCTSGKAKGKKVVYTVNVIADDDDDYDDDDYDDDYYDDYD